MINILKNKQSTVRLMLASMVVLFTIGCGQQDSDGVLTLEVTTADF